MGPCSLSFAFFALQKVGEKIDSKKKIENLSLSRCRRVVVVVVVIVLLCSLLLALGCLNFGYCTGKKSCD